MKPIRHRLLIALATAFQALVLASGAAAGAPDGDGKRRSQGAPPLRTAAVEVAAPDATLATLSYYNILGSALRPRNSANTYAYTSNGFE